jgi:type I restriction enzyme S subunit
MVAVLEPYMSYKTSSVPWLGEVPEHWEVGTLRRRLRSYDGIKIGPFGSQLKLDEMSASGYKVYGQANVIASDFARGAKFVDQNKFEELSLPVRCDQVTFW